MSAGILIRHMTVGLRILLGIIFLWSSWDKIFDPHGFASIIENYKILPGAWVNTVAVGLPWIEAFCGILLVTGRLVKGSLAIINSLMIIFIAALAWNQYRGIDIHCGCFSVAVQRRQETYIPNIMRNLAILVSGLWIMFSAARRDKTAPLKSKI